MSRKHASVDHADRRPKKFFKCSAGVPPAIVNSPRKGRIRVGEILLEDYLLPMGISQNAMARAIGVPPRAINEIVLGRRSITPAMSIRFGAFFGQSEDFWHGIQIECDFRALAKKRKELVKNITPATKLLAA
jgi:addiction module HigA family antidote